MAEKVLKATKRKALGSRAVSKLRRDGFTPAVFYGREYDSTAVAVNTKDLTKFLKTHGIGSKFEIELDGDVEMAIVKDFQKHPVKGTVTHLDFLHLVAGQKVKISIPVYFTGEDKVAKEFVVQKLLHEVEIEAFPKDLVDYISIDVEGMQIGESVTVADINRDDYPGIDFLTDPTSGLVVIVEATKYEEPETDGLEDGELAVADTSEDSGESSEE